MSNENNGTPALNNPVALTLLSLLAGIVFALISSFISNDHAIDFLIGISTTILSLQFSELRMASQTTPKLAILEQALAHSILFQLFENAINSHHKLDVIMKVYPRATKFYNEKLEYLCATSNLEWIELGQGRIIMNDEDRELSWGADILSLAQNFIYAVAYGDEDFWKRSEGRRYLDQHARLRDKGVQIIRIFVLSENRLGDQQPVILDQIKKGVEALIIPPGEIKEEDKEDFVIYDGVYVRYARQAYEYKKRATLSVEPNDLHKYINKFEKLKQRSESAEVFLKEYLS